MDIKIKDSDIYLTSSMNTVYIDGIDEIVQRVQIACTAKKGEFAYDRDFGIDLSDIDFESEMLEDILQLRIDEATLDIKNAQITLKSVDKTQDPVMMTLEIEYMGKTRETEVAING